MTVPFDPRTPFVPPVFTPIDYSKMPRLTADQPGLFSSALRTGWNELQSTGGAAVAALGKATGAKSLEQWGAEAAANQAAEADQHGRVVLADRHGRQRQGSHGGRQQEQPGRESHAASLPPDRKIPGCRCDNRPWAPTGPFPWSTFLAGGRPPRLYGRGPMAHPHHPSP